MPAPIVSREDGDRSRAWRSTGRVGRSLAARGARKAGAQRTARVVLQDMFAVPFDEITSIEGRSEVAVSAGQPSPV